MNIEVVIGDVLDTPADVMISTANPWLNMSGGVNGAIAARCPQIQEELHQWLESQFKTSIPAGSAVKTTAGSLPFKHIVHAVAIDPFYDSSLELVSKTLTAAFGIVAELGAHSVSMPTLATGFGPLAPDEFALAFRKNVVGKFELDRVTIVVRSKDAEELVQKTLFK